MKNLSEMTVQELHTLEVDLRAELKDRAALALSTAREKVALIASEAGVSIEELIATVRGTKKDKKDKKAVPARFQDPKDPSKKWSGRGMKPKFVREWLDAGNSIDALRIA